MTKNEFCFNDGSTTTDGGDDKNDFYSFRSINYDHMHLSHRDFSLKIDHANDSELHRKDASFVLEEMKRS